MKIVNINFKYECYFWIFNSESDLSALIVLAFQIPSKNNIKGISVRYGDTLTLLSTFKGTVDMN